MFGFAKDILLKHKILLYLDQHEQHVSSQSIAEQMQNVTGQTIRKNLRELETIISSFYSKEQMHLKISTREGILLRRNGVNFQPLVEQIYVDNMVYSIYCQLILHRSFSTDDFCKEYRISLSTLRRVIQRINAFFDPYQISLKVGRNVSIVGKESQIRCMFFLLMYFIHGKLSVIDWVEEEEYLALATKVCQVFYLRVDDEHLDVLALWLFINQVSADLGYALEEELVLENYNRLLPQDHFSDKDWNYILVIMYAFDFVDFEPELSFQQIYLNELVEPTNYWLELFEMTLHGLSLEERERIFHGMYKNFLLTTFVPINREIIKIVKPNYGNLIEENYAYFVHYFEKLWKAFIQRYPHFDESDMRAYVLDTCFYYALPEVLYTTVYCCWASKLPFGRSQLMEKIIKEELKTTAIIEFIKEPEKADLILATEASEKGVLVEVPLSIKDLSFLKKEIIQLIASKEVGDYVLLEV